jgi:diguanylate cyclase (GGDEF)-like protein
MIGTHTDISERKAVQERMQMLAHFDLLTGLPNRALFSDRLRQGLAKARRDKTSLALMMIDLDKFKPVNDMYGHQEGDLLLKEVAERMLACVRRETDTVARLGGDEFVVILSEIEQSKDATTVAEKIREALNQTFDISGHQVNISSCIGVAVFPEHGPDEALLIKSADAAMYRAKENGRNRVELAY